MFLSGLLLLLGAVLVTESDIFCESEPCFYIFLDCGNESGWMYKVNGWFPNYGCSKYMLEDGDTIVWCYTCNGLGADVGDVWNG